MILYLFKFIYETFILPPGIWIILLLVFAFWLYRRHRKGAFFLLTIVILFYLSTTFWVADSLIRSLENKFAPPLKLTGDVLVVLGGGATYDTPDVNGAGHLSGSAANRLLTCAQIYRTSPLPIIYSGGRVYRSSGDEAQIAGRILIGLGISKDKIILESQALNTSENAKYVQKLLAKYKFKAPILITSAFHMARAVKQFKKYSIKVVPFPTDYQANIHQRFELYQLWPSADALEKTQTALKEYLGLAVAKWY